MAKITKQQATPRAVKWASRRKVAVTLIGVIIVAMIAIGLYASMHPSQKFSKIDYEQLTTMAITTLKNSSGTSAQVKQECSYERPEELSNIRLYCTIMMVTYLPYDSDTHALIVARTLEREIKDTFGAETFGFSRFYNMPSNGSDTAIITLTKPFPSARQCNFYIESNRNARGVLIFPKKDDDNLIALAFECSAESQAEYYPVTYRQG